MQVDFSYSAVRYDDRDNWTWRLNIPAGGDEGLWTGDPDWEEKVLRLQRRHGCYNVTSGSCYPLAHPHHLGVYVGPHHGQHRDGFCHCFQDVKDHHWPPRY